jgi:hypothetical protein
MGAGPAEEARCVISSHVISAYVPRERSQEQQTVHCQDEPPRDYILDIQPTDSSKQNCPEALGEEDAELNDLYIETYDSQWLAVGYVCLLLFTAMIPFAGIFNISIILWV